METAMTQVTQEVGDLARLILSDEAAFFACNPTQEETEQHMVAHRQQVHALQGMAGAEFCQMVLDALRKIPVKGWPPGFDHRAWVDAQMQAMEARLSSD
jgi:hypothetical protein